MHVPEVRVPASDVCRRIRVAPGPAAGSERVYQSYIYNDRTLDIVAVDPETGSSQVFENPAPTESGAWCITAGPDGNVYLAVEGYRTVELPGAASAVQLEPFRAAMA